MALTAQLWLRLIVFGYDKPPLTELGHLVEQDFRLRQNIFVPFIVNKPFSILEFHTSLVFVHYIFSHKINPTRTRIIL